MRICFVSRIVVDHGVRGGMEGHLESLSQGLAARGHEVTILTAEHTAGVATVERNGVVTHFLRGSGTFTTYTRDWWQRSAEAFGSFNEKSHFDVLCSQSIGGAGCLHTLRPSGSCALVAIFHGTLLGNIVGIKHRAEGDRRLRKRVDILAMVARRYRPYARLVSHCDLAIAVSNSVARYLSWENPFAQRKIRVITNGIDVTRFRFSEEDRKQVRAALGVGDSDYLVLMVGSMVRAKGFHVGLRAVAGLLTDFPRLRVAIVGDGPDRDFVQGVASEVGLGNRVAFCGHVPNEQLPAYYCGCEIFLMPTLLTEASPLVVAEAMSCGRPVVASRIGGICNIVTEGVDGLLVQPGDVVAASRALRELLSDRSLANRLAQRALAKARERFGLEAMVDAYERLLTLATDARGDLICARPAPGQR